MHSMLCHALHEHHNPWLISSVNQWDSLIATTKVCGTPMVTQANSILEHHPSHQGWHEDCFQHNSSNTQHTSEIVYLDQQNISFTNNTYCKMILCWTFGNLNNDCTEFVKTIKPAFIFFFKLTNIITHCLNWNYSNILVWDTRYTNTF